MQKLIANCPKCHGELAFSSSAASVSCSYCGEVFAPPESERGTLDPSATADYVLSPAGTNQATLTVDGQPGRRRDGASDLQKIGRFEIRRFLGEGAFGAVYEAYDPQLDRAVAIKVAKLDRGDAEQRTKRFLREAKAAAGLRHPHIVPVHEFGQEGELFYIVSSFIKGRTLQADVDERKKKNQEADLQRAGRIVQHLADALAYAHGQGIVHRDVKPANVMLDDKDEPMLMDFGLATRQEEAEKLTHAGTVLGTPMYMAPEQARGKEADALPASDQYSLGVMLYEMIAGRPPFTGAPELVMFHHMETEPTSPRKHNRTISRDLETICLKCLEKDAAKRYPSERELADDLRRFRDGEPISARRIGVVERLGRWCRKNPLLATMTAALVAVILIAFTVVAWQLNVTTAALAREDHEKRQRVLAQVNALRDAAPGAVPVILAELEANRDTILPLLPERFAQEKEQPKRMRLALALVGAEAQAMRDELAAWMLQIDDPSEILLIRDALLPHKGDLVVRLWAVVNSPEKGKESQRLRGAAALAKFDPESENWVKVRDVVASDLVKVPAVYLAAWLESLRPVRAKLLTPLAVIFGEMGRRDAERSLATDILADYASDQSNVLADLLMDADEQQFAMLYRKVKDEKHGDHCVSSLLAEIDKQPMVVKDKVILESKGTIADDDVKVKTPSGVLPAKRFEVRLKGGKPYRLTMDSQDVDSFLVLQDKAGKRLASDDDGGGGVNSMLIYKPSSDDTYAVFAASLKGTGAFVLKITEVTVGDEGKEKLAKRQTNAAVALLRMGRSDEKVWRLFKHRPDPQVRSNLIHWLGPLGADAGAIVKRMKDEPEVTIRRALILSLGEFGDTFSPDERERFLPTLQEMYRTAADPGLHGSAEWLLRTWKQEAWLKQMNDDWAKDGEKRVQAAMQILAKEKGKGPPQWYVNGQGQTMVVIPGPVEFLMGSPPTEEGRADYEPQHKKQIGRTFAIAANSVTLEQYRQFSKGYQMPEKYARTANMPVIGIDWYMAAAYCNWLSNQEGIDNDQLVYETNAKGQVTRLKENYLSLAGYRLPTEAEMEYATRAETVTAWYHGDTEKLLAKYAWYAKNSKELTWPVGSLKPNDLGLFDMHGNVITWCQEGYRVYPTKKSEEADKDQEDELEVIGTESRVLRGGAFASQAPLVRSALRNFVVPTYRASTVGFRLARTLPRGS